MSSKLIICPFFGPFPPWMHRFLANFEAQLQSIGYDLLLTTNLDRFNQRCDRVLGFCSPIVPGTGKLHDYRPALGKLFQDELASYEFWGHVDFDVVFGRVEKFMTDSLLSRVDVYSDHHSYVCGPWTLYRNIAPVNNAFLRVPDWREQLVNPETSGWAEGSFSRSLENLDTAGIIRLRYGSLHRYEVDELARLRQDHGALYIDDEEIMAVHFRRTKEYPLP